MPIALKDNQYKAHQGITKNTEDLSVHFVAFVLN